MAVDESFKQPGSVPFKWEIQPGVPKPHHHQPSFKPSPKLMPPPAGAGNYYYPPQEVGSLSIRSTTRSRSVSSRLRSDRFRFDRPSSVEVITGSAGCFPPLMKRNGNKKRSGKIGPPIESEVDYTSDLETLARRSTSTRKMLSPFRDSVSSSSFISSPSPFSSVQSSPRTAGDAEWAAFGLF
ncbi:uncharacterized protein LOC122074611 [Macadamia integrifolia]|uniref:uncharacterized protein LOC122074611 n=1 Tax=Macadamia integrifolia TaxID=60698 RepID=UPI001C4F7917|nr:uncharacterized protein LOC122074611 [Macadamia integrifolia]